MRVGLITSVPLAPPWDQGDKNLAYRLTGALPQIQFQVLTLRGGPAPNGCNLVPRPLYRSSTPSLVQKLRVFGWFLLSARRSSPDLYHLLYQPAALSSHLLRRVPELRRRPSLHTVPATAGEHRLNPGMLLASQVVTLSEHGRHALEHAGVPRVVHIPQGISINGWSGLAEQTASFKTRLGIPDSPAILYPGHYSSGYGVRTVVQALPKIVAGVPDVRLLLACRQRSQQDRARERLIREEIEQMGLTHQVRFYETVTDMKALIGASDLVVLPLRTMRDKVDIPTTLLEALAAGKPVIISDIPPMNELIRADGAALHRDSVGLVVPPGDPCALANAVVHLLTEKCLLDQLGRRGQTLIQKRFDIRQVARQYERLYQGMIG
jgi:glycosyltransferase involved in cell wall biosynthesis